jgi:hypothetical protein
MDGMECCPAGTGIGEDIMNELPRIATVEPVIYGVLKIVWLDGYVGLVDLRSILESGEAFEPLRSDPEMFELVKADPHGHCIFWDHPDGFEIDFGADSLRLRAERQAALLKLAS